MTPEAFVKLIDEYTEQVKSCGRVLGLVEDGQTYLAAHLEEMEPEADAVREVLIDAFIERGRS